ncbi:unannotated protein [freshwater metagenome]|uniref:Unannotated protein n=1 Tax=freshwater metagenome TaxID=449393 RepID=A0A6J6EFR2_9ZZZZ
MTTNSIDLVNEDDGGSVLLGLFEEVAHSARSDTHEHLDEVRTRDRVERNARLTGNGTREKRLSGSGRAIEQDALRDACANGLELCGLLQEVLDFLQLFDCFVRPRDVGKSYRRRLFGHELGPRLAELHDSATATLHRGEHPPEEQTDKQQWEQEAQRGQQPVVARHLVIESIGWSGCVDRVDDVGSTRSDEEELNLVAIFLVSRGELEVDAVFYVNNRGLRHGVVLEVGESLIRGDLLKTGCRNKGRTNPDRRDRDEDVNERTSEKLLQKSHGENTLADCASLA